MSIIVPPDSVRDNIIFSAHEVCEEAPFNAFFKHRPALAMMAAMVADIIEVEWRVPPADFSVHVLEREPNISLQILSHARTPRSVQKKLNGFIALMRDTAEDGPASYKWSEENTLVTTRSERNLMRYIQNMVRRADISLGLGANDDPQADHASRRRRNEWQDVAMSGLRRSWLLATLPERAYLGVNHLLKDVYRIMHSVSFGFDRVEAMVTQKELEKKSEASGKEPLQGEKPRRDLVFYYH